MGSWEAVGLGPITELMATSSRLAVLKRNIRKTKEAARLSVAVMLWLFGVERRKKKEKKRQCRRENEREGGTEKSGIGSVKREEREKGRVGLWF